MERTANRQDYLVPLREVLKPLPTRLYKGWWHIITYVDPIASEHGIPTGRYFTTRGQGRGL